MCDHFESKGIFAFAGQIHGDTEGSSDSESSESDIEEGVIDAIYGKFMANVEKEVADELRFEVAHCTLRHIRNMKPKLLEQLDDSSSRLLEGKIESFEKEVMSTIRPNKTRPSWCTCS